MPKKHDVHVFTVVRVKVCGIEAENHGSAIAAALDRVDFYSLFSVPNNQGLETEFAEDFSDFLVDEVGDVSYKHSVCYRDACHQVAIQEPGDMTYNDGTVVASR